MTISASGVRRLLTLAALGPVAVIASACGTSSSSSSPTATVTVTATPSTGNSASTPGSSSSAPTSAGPAECPTTALRVRLGGNNGAAGTIYYNVDFTNVGSATCFLEGYPGVSLVSAGSGAGSQVGADAKRDPVTPTKQIVVAPGQSAHAMLGIAEAGNFPASKCNPVTAHWLKVFPPDQTVAAYVSISTQTCASTSVPTMRITTISAGA